MGSFLTATFVPDESEPPVTADGRDGGWLIAPEYDGTGPFWFCDDNEYVKERNDAHIYAIALPLPNGRWYYHERDDWDREADDDWQKRLAETREAFATGYREILLYTKA